MNSVTTKVTQQQPCTPTYVLRLPTWLARVLVLTLHRFILVIFIVFIIVGRDICPVSRLHILFPSYFGRSPCLVHGTAATTHSSSDEFVPAKESLYIQHNTIYVKYVILTHKILYYSIIPAPVIERARKRWIRTPIIYNFRDTLRARDLCAGSLGYWSWSPAHRC